MTDLKTDLGFGLGVDEVHDPAPRLGLGIVPDPGVGGADPPVR